jgi:quercetin dioxygenase-like cupin family protein
MQVAVRRVVTGHDPLGRAVVVRDEIAPRTIEFRKGCDTALIWTTEGFPADNGDSEDPSLRDIGTSVADGTVFRVIDFAPGGAPRRHRTESIDYAIVISGEIWMELEVGDEVLLRAGDVLVQRGTVHNWINRSSEVCRIAFVLIAARAVQTNDGSLAAHG